MNRYLILYSGVVIGPSENDWTEFEADSDEVVHQAFEVSCGLKHITIEYVFRLNESAPPTFVSDPGTESRTPIIQEEPTNEMLAKYVGGQMEIQNQEERYLFRGEVATINIENEKLRIRFTWLAKNNGFPEAPEKWIRDDNLDYEISLGIFSFNNIGPSGAEIGGDDRLCFSSHIFGETAILFPPNGSKLDPKKVEGLDLAKA